MSDRTQSEKTMSKHTPGPWRKRKGFSSGAEVYPARRVAKPFKPAEICEISDLYDEWRANADLIVAAPDLLAALLLHVAYESTPADRGGNDGPKGKAWTAFIEARDKAIAKAKGGAS